MYNFVDLKVGRINTETKKNGLNSISGIPLLVFTQSKAYSLGNVVWDSLKVSTVAFASLPFDPCWGCLVSPGAPGVPSQLESDTNTGGSW